jgi:hypothetical protein
LTKAKKEINKFVKIEMKKVSKSKVFLQFFMHLTVFKCFVGVCVKEKHLIPKGVIRNGNSKK